MAQRVIIIGGGAAGIGAAGAAKAAAPSAEVIVYTEFEDVGYSPCGIPYVHGKEIPDFQRLFLADRQAYVDAGIDVRYETRALGFDPAARTVQIEGEDQAGYDALIVATGFGYRRPGVPGEDLDGLYYVKNIRRAMAWDEVLDSVRHAVVVEASPLGLEMVTALAHRGIDTHVVDPHPWALGELCDPDTVAPVQESWAEMGVTMHWDTKLQGFIGDGDGHVKAVATSDGELPAELVVVATHKAPNNALAVAAGLRTGSTGGLVVDDHMRTSAPHVWAAGDVCEIPHGLGGLPLQGLTGSHAYAQGKVAGTNAAGGDRAYQPVYVPWAMVAGAWMIGGAALGEVAATALGVPHVVGRATGISRARYFPGVRPITIKLLAEPGTLRLIGAQMVGGEGIKERADFLALAIRKGITLYDLASMENVYSPPIGALNEPIVTAAQAGVAT
ncbi:FAD-dependent oxidoreductase [Nonomuraea sp. NPDC049152]|uniref:FAD-dependent oxidoreductase n=1 Tax=Nonomuraea sp. NPDC049152 TaxID=3154350 RepID=UPI0033EB19E7